MLRLIAQLGGFFSCEAMHQIPFLSLQERPPLSDTSETPFFMRIEQIMMLLSRHVKRKKSRAVLAAFISFSYKNHLTALQIAEQWRGELETSRAISNKKLPAALICNQGGEHE
ncbi:hypothetical protein [Caballeronia sp.]|uniref:hypothetical protein n=1 Tax=Caballeronia sp. TaxID=1931223 RepID=UPI003C5DF352